MGTRLRTYLIFSGVTSVMMMKMEAEMTLDPPPMIVKTGDSSTSRVGKMPWK